MVGDVGLGGDPAVGSSWARFADDGVVAHCARATSEWNAFCSRYLPSWLRYYTEPKRLARLGYLDARGEPGNTRERTVYSLTDEGLEALREYARTPVTFTPVKNEMLLRMLMCDLVGDDVTRASVATIRADIADIWWRLDEADRAAAELPHRERNLVLVTGFLRRLLQLHLDFADEVERELQPAGSGRRGQG